MKQVLFDFTGKNFVVTGASSGLGKQIAIELAQSGAQVLGIARGTSALETLKQECPQIQIAPCDVTDSIALELAIANFVSTSGKFSGSIHCAGISGLTPLKSIDFNFAQQIMATSFWAGISLVRLVTKAKYGQQATSNILFSSVSGNRGQKGMFAYSAAKASLKVASQSLAKEIANKMHRVNTISPGWVTTQMSKNFLTQLPTTFSDNFKSQHVLGLGYPEDISGMALFLLSERARWITGADFVVDGGFLA